jgi:hypothetical protein
MAWLTLGNSDLWKGNGKILNERLPSSKRNKEKPELSHLPASTFTPHNLYNHIRLSHVLLEFEVNKNSHSLKS